MSLTEDWKSGKLPRGKKYWCRMVGGEIEICYLWLQTNQFTLLVGYQSRDLPEDDIIEILALCDYGYISELESKNKHLLDLQANQDKEVEKLWKLLWECKDYIDFCSVPEGFGKSYIAENLLTRINEVLGNDK